LRAAGFEPATYELNEVTLIYTTGKLVTQSVGEHLTRGRDKQAVTNDRQFLYPVSSPRTFTALWSG